MEGVSLKVSRTGLDFLMETAHEARIKKIQRDETEKVRNESFKKRLDEVRRLKIVEQAKELYAMRNLKKEVIRDVKIEESSEKSSARVKPTASFLLNKAKSKRYPNEKSISPFEMFLNNPKSPRGNDYGSPIEFQRARASRSTFYSDNRGDYASFQDRDKVNEALQSIIEANTEISPHNTRSIRQMNKAKRQEISQHYIEDEFDKPQHVLHNAIAELQLKSEEEGKEIAQQVATRLERFKMLNPSELSDNCASEISQIQKLGHLFQKHAEAVHSYEKRREVEQKGRLKLCDKRVKANKIIKRIDQVGDEFDQLGGTLGFNCKGKIPPSMIKESLRVLKNIKQNTSQKPIQNTKVKTERSESTQHLNTFPLENLKTIMRHESILTLPFLSPRAKEFSYSKSLLYK